jgi:hypothetical protein
MHLPVIFIFLSFLFLILLLSFRISLEVIAKKSGIAYTVKATLFKYVKVVEVKSGQKKTKKSEKSTEGRKKKWKTSDKESKAIHERVIDIIYAILKKNRGKIFHIEELSISGSFSLEDAALDAILYGTLIILWQFLIIYLSANFSLEHQSFKFYPDFKNNTNELVFHGILRVVIIQAIFVLIKYSIDKKKIKRKSE